MELQRCGERVAAAHRYSVLSSNANTSTTSNTTAIISSNVTLTIVSAILDCLSARRPDLSSSPLASSAAAPLEKVAEDPPAVIGTPPDHGQRSTQEPHLSSPSDAGVHVVAASSM